MAGAAKFLWRDSVDKGWNLKVFNFIVLICGRLEHAAAAAAAVDGTTAAWSDSLQADCCTALPMGAEAAAAAAAVLLFTYGNM